MADVELDSLQLQITSDAKGAKAGLDALIDTLDKLKQTTKGGAGLTAVANQVGKLATEAGKLSGQEGAKLGSLAKGLKALSGLGDLKLSSSIANQISAVGNAVKTLDGVSFDKVKDLATALQPLTLLGKSNLGSVLNQLKKIPEVMTELNKVDMEAFRKKIEELTAAIKPLADEMQKVSNGFAALPAKVRKLIGASSKVPASNKSSAKSFANLASKMVATFYAFTRGAKVIASWINLSNEYIENQNLFSVALGEYAGEAQKYAENVGEVMGIDPSEWMRGQGVLMTLATGFGVAGDRAYTMSQQLTQLGYDLSSFYNVSVEEAMSKIKSGFAGELEPLRSWGYDLSQAKLEAIALSLGIDKSVSSMTQAEKAQLRYYAIMSQVTTAQGDMARTLDDPANQLRILRAQVTQAARALGDLFIPILRAVLPWLIAAAKMVRYLADTLAGLFGIKSESKDLGGLSNISSGASDIAEEFDNASGSAAKLKKTLLGIDELNVMSDPSSGGSGGAGVSGGGGFDFELPTYDFIGEATSEQIDNIVGKMKEWLGLTGEIDSWAEFFDTRLGNILITVGAIGTAFALWKIGSSIFAAVGAIKGAIDAVLGAWAGFSTAVTTATGVSIGAILAVVAAIAAVAAGLTAVYLTNEDVKTSVDNAVASIRDALVPLFEFVTSTVLPDLKAAWDGLLEILRPLGEWVEMVFTSIWEDVLIPALEWLGSTAIPDVTNAFQNLWDKVLVPLGTFIGSVLSPVISILSDVLTWLWQYVVVPIADFIGGVFATTWKNIVKIFNETVIPIVNLVISVLQFLWKNVLAPVVTFLWDVFGAGFKEVFKSIGSLITSAKNIFQGLINFVAGKFTGDWKQAWNGVVQLFGGIFSGLKALITTPLNVALAQFESFINKIITGWNGLKKQINKLSINIPDWLGGGKLGFDLKMSSSIKLPRLADGGMMENRGQLFVANEAGPELVANVGNRTVVMNNDQIVESVSRGVYQAVVSAMGSSRGDQVIEAKVNDKVLFEVMVSRARQETVRTGYNPLLGGA